MSLKGLKPVNDGVSGFGIDVCIFCDANKDKCTTCDSLDWGDQDCGYCDGWANDQPCATE